MNRLNAGSLGPNTSMLTNRQKVKDEYFGNVESYFDETEKKFCFEKTIHINYFKSITLTILSNDNSTIKKQFDLFTQIKSNFDAILNSGDELYTFGSKNILQDYEIDRIEINDFDSKWELSLLKQNGFEYCIIEFEELDAFHISFQA